MARDLDFVPRRRPTSPTAIPSLKTNLKKTPRDSGGLKSVWLILILLALLAGAGLALWQSFQPVSNSAGEKIVLSPNTSTLPNDSRTPPRDLVSDSVTGLNVQVYDSGAGKAAAQDLTDKLKVLGYRADNLEKSQFNYDRTYLWYREGLLEEADKVRSAMPDRLVTFKETKIAGLFDILILLGTK